jgi:hypothetical protein
MAPIGSSQRESRFAPKIAAMIRGGIRPAV